MEKTKRKNMRKSIKNNEKGITLVALVVTIVVLLILAGVSLNLVLSDNGIVNKAKDAKNKTIEAQRNDELALNEMNDWMENLLGDSSVPPTKGTIVDGVTIPVGFYYVGGTKDSGLVISDDPADENDYKDQEIVGTNLVGNQFVWIPVEDYNKFHLIEGYWNGSLDSMLSEAENPSREAGSTTTAGTPLEKNNTAGTPESIAMYKSVKDNKGFYIARYEAGIDAKDASKNPVANSTLTTKTVADGTVKPLSKYGKGVWNFIPWGGTSALEATDGMQGNDNADGAVKVARSMYTKNPSCGVTSTLCYGVQWDAIMNFIDPEYVNESGDLTSFVANSTDEWTSDNAENTSKTVHTTGYHAVKNIYDLGGNVYEWTMEAYDAADRVSRGGRYDRTGSSNPASIRLSNFPYSYNVPTYNNDDVGFRPSLFL